ncbi:hypothetical protein AB3S75_022973 [Citrus x aurantiifolia]
MELIHWKSQQYVRLEDNKALQQQITVKVSVAPPPTPQDGGKRSMLQRMEEENKRRKPDERQFEPLNASLYQNWMENNDSGIFHTPGPIKAPLEIWNQSKFVSSIMIRDMSSTNAGPYDSRSRP